MLQYCFQCVEPWEGDKNEQDYFDYHWDRSQFKHKFIDLITRHAETDEVG